MESARTRRRSRRAEEADSPLKASYRLTGDTQALYTKYYELHGLCMECYMEFKGPKVRILRVKQGFCRRQSAVPELLVPNS